MTYWKDNFDIWFFGTEGPRPTDLEMVRVAAVKNYMAIKFAELIDQIPDEIPSGNNSKLKVTVRLNTIKQDLKNNWLT